MKIIQVEGVVYVKKWTGLYYIVVAEAGIFMVRVRKWRGK